MDVAHVTRIEGPDDSAGGQQLTLTKAFMSTCLKADKKS
jgi:hypothetical protein